MALNRLRQGSLLSLALIIVTAGCQQKARVITVAAMPSPVSGQALVPQVTPLSGGRLLLSWQTPLPEGGYAFSIAIRSADGRWSEGRPVSTGPELSMFTADLPGVAQMPDGTLLAYWEVKDGRDGDPYATNIQTSLSRDNGTTWTASSQPYGNRLSGQHSFLSWFPAKDGIGLLWLDAEARSQVRHISLAHGHSAMPDNMGSIGLRFADIDTAGHLRSDSFVAPITCECCPTSAAVTARGPVVVYRGRQDPPGTTPSEVRTDLNTVRDIYIARLESGKWTTPHKVYADNWVINACPDNGPAIDVAGNNVAVAWWTRPQGVPKVEIAFSTDSGETFGVPIRADLGNPEGQVTIAILPEGKSAIIGWLEGGQTWARFVSGSGSQGPAVSLGSAARHSRLPRWVAESNGVTAFWTARQEKTTQVRVSRLSW